MRFIPVVITATLKLASGGLKLIGQPLKINAKAILREGERR